MRNRFEKKCQVCETYVAKKKGYYIKAGEQEQGYVLCAEHYQEFEDANRLRINIMTISSRIILQPAGYLDGVSFRQYVDILSEAGCLYNRDDGGYRCDLDGLHSVVSTLTESGFRLSIVSEDSLKALIGKERLGQLKQDVEAKLTPINSQLELKRTNSPVMVRRPSSLLAHEPRTARERWVRSGLIRLFAEVDVGFNSRDEDYGRSLANTIMSTEQLTPKQWVYAIRMLKKYQVKIGQMPAAEPSDYALANQIEE